MARSRIALIGAGQIGGTLAHLAGMQGSRRNRAVRRGRRRAARQGARPVAGRAGREIQPEDQGRQRICRDQGRRCGDRHRRRAAETRHEPRRSPRNQPQGHGAGWRRLAQIRAGSLRHLRHQPARRHGLGAAEDERPAAQQGGRHGRHPRCGAVPLLPRRGIRCKPGGRDGDGAWRPWRHHGAAHPLLDRGRHPAHRSREDALDHAEAAR